MKQHRTAAGMKNKIWFLCGMLAVLVMGIPYLLLGEDAAFIYHDQLDGELIAYILQARHLFQGNTLPEFLGGGMSKTALTMPAPACVLLFLGNRPYLALAAMQLAGSLCGYAGMFLLVRKAADKCWCAAMTGVLYAYLTFLPVYGLSQYGLPLLLWFVWEIREGRRWKSAWCYGAVFALCSSLALVGFGVLGCLSVWCLWMYVNRAKENEGAWKRTAILTVSMLVIYLAENLSLLAQLFGAGESYVSHKAEYVLHESEFTDGFWQAFLYGGQHSGDFHVYFLPFIGIVLVLGILCGDWRRDWGREPVQRLLLIFCANTGIAVTAALWESGAGILLRSRLSVLGAFQLNRLLWLSPCLWYLALGGAAALAVEQVRHRNKGRLLYGLVVCGLMVVLTGRTGFGVLQQSMLKTNVRKLWNPGYKIISFRDYYAIGVLEQVEEYIRETTGQTQEEYRVVSLGIDPAAALYHGFYCLDGYSNNYDLEYKHAFRRILQPELAKSQYLTDYFDDWGNRCYLFSSEAAAYYTIQKGGFYFQNYEIDVQALKEMGGTYLISAAYIANAQEQGLLLLQEDGFETQDSYYRIFLYEVE